MLVYTLVKLASVHDFTTAVVVIKMVVVEVVMVMYGGGLFRHYDYCGCGLVSDGYSHRGDYVKWWSMSSCNGFFGDDGNAWRLW